MQGIRNNKTKKANKAKTLNDKKIKIRTIIAKRQEEKKVQKKRNESDIHEILSRDALPYLDEKSLGNLACVNKKFNKMAIIAGNDLEKQIALWNDPQNNLTDKETVHLFLKLDNCNINLNEKQIDLLINTYNPEIYKILAMHTEQLTNIQFRQIVDFDKREVHKILATHEPFEKKADSTELDRFDKLFALNNSEVNLILAKNISIDDKDFDKLFALNNLDINIALASNQLFEYADDDVHFNQLLSLNHPAINVALASGSISDDHFDKLFALNDIYTNISLAKNFLLNDEQFNQLKALNNPYVNQALKQNTQIGG
jgi:hypothetical protein